MKPKYNAEWKAWGIWCDSLGVWMVGLKTEGMHSYKALAFDTEREARHFLDEIFYSLNLTAAESLAA